MANKKTMRSFISAIALCAVLQPALADNGTAPVRSAAPSTAPVVMQAALTPATAVDAVPGAAATATTVAVAGIKADAGEPKPPQEGEHRPTTVALLLTAFLVMTGIALRRWGTDES
jgi:hypothetical protein